MQSPRLGTALLCAALLLGPARSAEPFDVERDPATLPPVVSPVVIGVDARSSFLRTNGEHTSPSWPINLAHLGLKPGDLLRFEVLGDFAHSAGNQPDNLKQMIAVFSSSPTLLAGDKQNRVPGAIAAGTQVFTPATLVGGRDTDIAQDFAISSAKVRIPAGARFLFVAAPDIYYSDNQDPDGDFAVRITVF
jgi:hypothetical protein